VDKPTYIGHLHCTAEWHLRECPRAVVVYSLSLHLSEVQPDGKRYFWLSVRQVADYFEWHKNTVLLAIASLKKSGLFKLVKKGGGKESSRYQVLTHFEVARESSNSCKAVSPKGQGLSNGVDGAVHPVGQGSTSGQTGAVHPVVTDLPIDSPTDASRESTSHPTKRSRPDGRQAPSSILSEKQQAKAKAEILAAWMSDTVAARTKNDYSVKRCFLTKTQIRELANLLLEATTFDDHLTMVCAFYLFLQRPKGFEGLYDIYGAFLKEYAVWHSDAANRINEHEGAITQLVDEMHDEAIGDDPSETYASGVTSKPANGGHVKTGQRKVAWD
jgi:hypothetical protein